uniref:BHLH transcription factor bHLH10.3 n=1 Tax=Gardenia jasminoides TaxID=114476 RepID=A0A6M4C8M6_GARJA|nr:bHLH transcription factor bHLH10.3 [Gardenia jasminoides]
MAHIAVERNRRKQMNEYLSVLRGLMPEAYVQKGDQASIVGGAINYVKELEQQLQFLDGQSHMNRSYEDGSSSSSPFSEFFTYPQYSATMTSSAQGNRLAAADIEVTMVENHAYLKVRSRKRPKLLMKIVSGLQSLRLTILHLNVTTADQIVLYSISLKAEDDCRLTTVDEIAAAVNKMLRRIQEEAAAFSG